MANRIYWMPQVQQLSGCLTFHVTISGSAEMPCCFTQRSPSDLVMQRPGKSSPSTKSRSSTNPWHWSWVTPQKSAKTFCYATVNQERIVPTFLFPTAKLHCFKIRSLSHTPQVSIWLYRVFTALDRAPSSWMVVCNSKPILSTRSRSLSTEGLCSVVSAATPGSPGVKNGEGDGDGDWDF